MIWKDVETDTATCSSTIRFPANENILNYKRGTCARRLSPLQKNVLVEKAVQGRNQY